MGPTVRDGSPTQVNQRLATHTLKQVLEEFTVVQNPFGFRVDAPVLHDGKQWRNYTRLYSSLRHDHLLYRHGDV